MTFFKDIARLPFTLPGMIAGKVAPKVDLLTPDKKLDRRILWAGIGGAVCGSAAVLAFIGAGLLTSFAFIFANATATFGPPLALAAGGYIAATAAAICNKTRIDSLVIKVMNEVASKAPVTASADEMNRIFGTRGPEITAPVFNHAAATKLDKDIQVKPAIKLARRGVST